LDRRRKSELGEEGSECAEFCSNYQIPLLWKSEQKLAFENLKKALTTTPVLAVPDMDKPFFVTTDASGYAMGGSLEQMQDGKRRVIAFMSKKFTALLNFTARERTTSIKRSWRASTAMSMGHTTAGA
jgi:hypothetical protein